MIIFHGNTQSAPKMPPSVPVPTVARSPYNLSANQNYPPENWSPIQLYNATVRRPYDAPNGGFYGIPARKPDARPVNRSYCSSLCGTYDSETEELFDSEEIWPWFSSESSLCSSEDDWCDSATNVVYGFSEDGLYSCSSNESHDSTTDETCDYSVGEAHSSPSNGPFGVTLTGLHADIRRRPYDTPADWSYRCQGYSSQSSSATETIGPTAVQPYCPTSNGLYPLSALSAPTIQATQDASKGTSEGQSTLRKRIMDTGRFIIPRVMYQVDGNSGPRKENMAPTQETVTRPRKPPNAPRPPPENLRLKSLNQLVRPDRFIDRRSSSCPEGFSPFTPEGDPQSSLFERLHETAQASQDTQIDPENEIAQASQDTQTDHENEIAQASQDTQTDHDNEVAQASQDTQIDHENEIPQASEDTQIDPENEIAQASQDTQTDHDNEIAQASQDTQIDHENEIAQASQDTQIDHENEEDASGLHEDGASAAPQETPQDTAKDADEGKTRKKRLIVLHGSPVTRMQHASRDWRPRGAEKAAKDRTRRAQSEPLCRESAAPRGSSERLPCQRRGPLGSRVVRGPRMQHKYVPRWVYYALDNAPFVFKDAVDFYFEQLHWPSFDEQPKDFREACPAEERPRDLQAAAGAFAPAWVFVLKQLSDAGRTRAALFPEALALFLAGGAFPSWTLFPAEVRDACARLRLAEDDFYALDL